MSKKLLSNSVSNLIDFIATVVITFLLTPIYLKSFGMYDYGLWELVNAIIGYMGLLDLGMGHAIVRETSYFSQRNKHQKVNILYATSMVYMSFIGLTILLIAFAWALISPESLAEQPGSADKYQLFLILVGLTVLFSFMLKTAEGMLGGKQLFVKRNVINLIIKVSVAIILYFNLTADNGINFMLQVALGATILRVLAYNGLLLALTPKVTFWVMPSIRMFKRLVSFGAKSLVNGMAFTLEMSSGTILIGSILSPALIPLLSIPSALANYVSKFLESVTAVLLPYFTEIAAQKDMATFWQRYLSFSKICLAYISIASVFLFFFGAPFIDIWLDKSLDMNEVNNIIIWLCLSLIIERINPLGTTVMTAINKHVIYAKLRPISAACIFTLTYFLLSYIGIVGALIALICVRTIFAPIYIYFIAKAINKNAWEYFYKAVAPNVLLAMLLWGAGYYYSSVVEVINYFDVLYAGTYCLLVGLICCFLIVLNGTERAFIVNKLNKLTVGKSG